MAVFHDLSGRAAGPAALRVRGVIVLLVVAIVGFVAQRYYVGKLFNDDFRIQVDATTIGEGLAKGADVKYRGLRIGAVEDIEPRGFGHQILTLALERRQATTLTSDITARYQASNIFGAPGIELMTGVGGPPLQENSVVKIDSSGKVASVTNALRQVASLTSLLGTDKVQRLLRLIVRNGDLLGPTVRFTTTFARIYAGSLRKTIVQIIQEATPFINGLSIAVGPFIRVLEALYEDTEFLADPENKRRTIEAVENLKVLLFDNLGATLDNLKSPLTDTLGVIADVGEPLFMSAGSAASAWGNLENFLNRAEDAMPTIDGKVKLQLEILLPASRALPETDGDEAAPGLVQEQGQQRQLTPQQQQQMVQLQTEILGRAAQPQPGQPSQQSQSGQPPPAQPGQPPQAKQPGADFAQIPTSKQEGGLK